MRKLVLGIPAQASGKNLTRPLMPSAPQTSCVRATSPHHRKLGAGYVALPQMTGRRFGKPFILSPPTLALRFRQNNGPTPTGDYQPSRSLSMAGSGCSSHTAPRRLSRSSFKLLESVCCHALCPIIRLPIIEAP